MQLIKLTKAIEHEGLVVGDVLSVDERSAAHLIKEGEAEEYEPKAADKVPTIDDIPSTAKGRTAVMSAVRVGSPDPGPASKTVEEVPAGTVLDDEAASLPKKTAAKTPPAAPGAEPAGGDAGGGDTG